jgi:hypothetical protein
MPIDPCGEFSPARGRRDVGPALLTTGNVERGPRGYSRAPGITGR